MSNCFPRIAIGDSTIHVSDGNYSSKYPKSHEFLDSGIPFVSANNLRNGRIIRDNLKFISKEQHADLKKGHVRTGDVLLVTRGSLGLTGLVTSEFDDANINAQLVLLRADNKTIDARYLFFVANSRDFQSQVVQNASGTAQPQLPIGPLKRLTIPIPSLLVQRRIAGILSAYDDLIENNRKRIAILDEMARRLYREWFVHFRYPGHESVPLVDSPLGRIPQGWEVKPFAALAEYRNGYAFKPDDWGTTGVPIIKIRELKAGVTSETPRNTGDNIPGKYRVENGDILFSWSADLDSYLWNGGPGLLNQHLFLVIPSTDIPKDWLFHALKEGMPRFRALSLGATMHHIKRSALDQVATLWPGSRAAEQFAGLTKPWHDLGINLYGQIAVLRRTRDLLLPRLMSGRLSVTAAEAAVP